MRVPESEIAREISHRHTLFVVFRAVIVVVSDCAGLAYRDIDRHDTSRLKSVHKIIYLREIPPVLRAAIFSPCAVEPQLAYFAVFSAEQGSQM